MRPCALAAVYGVLVLTTLAWDAARRQPPAAVKHPNEAIATAQPALALPVALPTPLPPVALDSAWAPAPAPAAPPALLPWRASPDASSCASFSDAAVRSALARHAADVAQAQHSACASTLLGVAAVAVAGAAARRKAAKRLRGNGRLSARGRDETPATPSAALRGVPSALEVLPPAATSAQLTQSSGLLFRGGGDAPNATTEAGTAALPESPFGTPRRAARAAEVAAAAAARAWRRNEHGRLKSHAAAEAASDDDDCVCSPRL